jgi:putative YphP/YqiW family bacilliredoxin
MCGCAARNARPAIRHAVQNAVKPQRLLTVFSGQDGDATRQARTFITGYAPSSPSMALFKDGQLVYMMERWQIEGRDAGTIATELVAAFEEHCAEKTAAA